MMPALFLGVGIYFLPSSLGWLMFKGRAEEALQSLIKLRRMPASDSRVKLEHLDIVAEVLSHKEVSAEGFPSFRMGAR